MLPDRSFSELFADDHADPMERRTAPRIPVEVDVIVAAEGQFFSGVSGDISKGGIFVWTSRVLSVGTRVMLELTLPTGQVLARGNVRWLRRGAEGVRSGLGIELEELPSIDRAIVDRFCDGRPRFYTYDEIVAATH